MFIRNSKLGNFTLTFVFYVALFLALSVCSDAKDFHLQHRDHANLKRLIKKRAPPLLPVAGAAAAVPVFPSPGSAVTSPTPSTSQSTTSGSTSASETGTLSTSSSSSSTTTSSTISTSQNSTSTSTTHSTTSSTSTTQPPSVTPTPDSTSTPPPKSTVTQIESVNPTSTSSSVPLAQSGASTTKSTTLTVVIVIASCVAGIAILWTVFRKWKLGRSSKFDERLQPIDWHPTDAEDAGQRRFSTGALSFQSGGGRGGGSTRGGSDHGHGGSDHGLSHGLPDHDFTAGSAALAPVGGYADLARGSSPQPPMYQVTRGPSLTRPAYDVGVPLHHQAGYSTQDAYGGSRF